MTISQNPSGTQVGEHSLICDSGSGVISLNKTLLSLLQTPVHALLSFETYRRTNPFSLVEAALQPETSEVVGGDERGDKGREE